MEHLIPEKLHRDALLFLLQLAMGWKIYEVYDKYDDGLGQC